MTGRQGPKGEGGQGEGDGPMQITLQRVPRVSRCTEHETAIGGERVRYRAEAEETCAVDGDGTELAGICSYSYLRTDGADVGSRPVLFAFNGGPGSSSVWLHLGLFGPFRVKTAAAEEPAQLPPFELEANPHCLLDICDIVVVDPVGAGYSRLYRKDAAALFYGVRQDARVFALFIEEWLNRHGRLNSPRFLAGESYGTLRACMLLGELMGGPFGEGRCLAGIAVNGLLMLGTSLTLSAMGNLPPIYPELLWLPSQAAVNHYHHPEGKPALRDFVEEAWRFSRGEYLVSLFEGEELPEGKKARASEKLAYFTGLPADWYRRHGLKANDWQFRSLVLQREGLDVGAYDGRYVMVHSEQQITRDPVMDDPAMGKYSPAFTAGMDILARRELGLSPEREYRAIDFAVNADWDYQSPVSPTEALTSAMRRNGRLRVFFGSGLYDLVTPPGAVRYLAAHLDLPRDRLTIREYESGHMPYLGEGSAAALSRDLRSFIRQALAAP